MWIINVSRWNMKTEKVKDSLCYLALNIKYTSDSLLSDVLLLQSVEK